MSDKAKRVASTRVNHGSKEQVVTHGYKRAIALSFGYGMGAANFVKAFSALGNGGRRD